MSSAKRNADGTFKSKEQEIEEAVQRRLKAAKEHGYSIKEPHDYYSNMRDELEKRGLYGNDKVDDFGFGSGFLKFLGLKESRNYRVPIQERLVQSMTVFNKKSKVMDFITDINDVEDSREYYTPLDDFYSSTPGGGDMVSDYGRVPVNHLMTLCSQRLGVAYRGCNGIANDVFRNKFEFVEIDNIDKVVKRKDIFNWMLKSKFMDKVVDCLDFEGRTGLGHLVGYYPNEKNVDNIGNRAPNSRPESFESFSSYWMTPANLQDINRLDYDKQQWDFIGGIRNVSTIHHTRVYVLETRRVEGGLRGIALPELCWTPLMCYLNTAYYILKSLSQLGTSYMVFESEKPIPTVEEMQAYITLADSMRANKTIVVGKGATFTLENAAGKIGTGVESYMEFLREDISSAWIIPKNQLFGRAQGGGLEGAGALISKEDYLGSNISVKQLQITNDLMYIFQEMCHFSGLEDKTIRWNIDLHKTEQQRLTEQLMAEQLEQAKVQTKMAKINGKLFTIQAKLQEEITSVQLEMVKKNPQKFLAQTQKDEQNIEGTKKAPKEPQVEKKETKNESKPRQDFIQLGRKLEILQKQYDENNKLIWMINGWKNVNERSN